MALTIAQRYPLVPNKKLSDSNVMLLLDNFLLSTEGYQTLIIANFPNLFNFNYK